jgi:hypothetical protein
MENVVLLTRLIRPLIMDEKVVIGKGIADPPETLGKLPETGSGFSE